MKNRRNIIIIALTLFSVILLTLPANSQKFWTTNALIEEATTPPGSGYVGAEDIIRWPNKTISWEFDFGDQSFGNSDVHGAIFEAYDAWDDVTTSNFTFTDVLEGAESSEGFGYDEHNVHYWPPATETSLLQRLGTAPAATFYTVNSDAVILDIDIVYNTDLADPWSTDGSTSWDVFDVAIHEIGHQIGFTHTTNSNSVMYGSNPVPTTLDAEDIAGISFLSGNIIHDETLSPTNSTFEWDITVAAGKTITVPSGKTLSLDDITMNFGSGADLVINGAIDADDVIFQGVSNGTWGGITFSTTSATSIIENSTIRKITGAASVDIYRSNNVTLSRNLFTDNDWGITIQGHSSQTTNPTIEYNEIDGSTGSGISISAYANPLIK